MTQLLRQGRIEDFDFEDFDLLFEEGETGEILLYLSDVDEADHAQIAESVAELDQDLRQGGAQPWPGNFNVAFINWSERTVHIRFTQGFPALLVLIPIITRLGILLVSLGVVAKLVAALGFDLPSEVNTVADALLIIGSLLSLGGLRWLRLAVPFLIPALVVGGGLLFASLHPDLAFRLFKVTADVVADVVTGLIPKEVAWAVAGALVLLALASGRN
jgi:hypothetical protein